MKGFTLCRHPETLRAAISGSNKTGFTLIELLVVVLIIGILAAVALPQYNKAVAKSRFAQIVTAAKSLADAQSVYYMANGEYATELDQLDVSFPAESETHLDTVSFKKYGNCKLQRDRILCMATAGGRYAWSVWAISGKSWCCAYSTDNYAASSLCVSFTGKELENWFNGCGSDETCHCWAG